MPLNKRFTASTPKHLRLTARVTLRWVLLLSISSYAFPHPRPDTQLPAALPPIPRRLTLAEGEALLLQRNLAIATSRYQIEAAQAVRLIASYKPNPVLSIGAEQLRLDHHLFPTLIYTDSNLAAQSTYTMRLDKIIERGGKRELRQQQTEFQLKAAEAQLLDSIRVQLFQLRQAFTSALLARENLRLAEMIQQQYDQTERLTKIKVENGDLAGMELYRARAGRLQYQQMVLQSRSAYEQATRDLLNILAGHSEDVAPSQIAWESNAGLNIERTSAQPSGASQLPPVLGAAPLEVVGSFSDQPISLNLAELRKTALAERPDVIAARNVLEAAGRGFLLAKAQRARDIDIASEYQRIGSDNTLGVVIQIPLFVYNNQRAAIEQAAALRRAAETQLKQVQMQASTDVDKAFIAYQSARRILELYSTENLTNLDRLRNITTISFREGAVSLFEVLDVQRTYNQAATAYNQARADYQMSLWQMEQAVGRPLQ